MTYEVDESDEVFAKPEGLELLARVYRPRGAAGPLPARTWCWRPDK